MHSDRRGNGQKAPRTKPSKQKTKTPDKNSREQLRDNLYRGLLSGFFVLGLIIIGGPRCVTYFRGGSGMCDKVWQGRRGDKNWPKIAWRTLWTAPRYAPRTFPSPNKSSRAYFSQWNKFFSFAKIQTWKFETSFYFIDKNRRLFRRNIYLHIDRGLFCINEIARIRKWSGKMRWLLIEQ